MKILVSILLAILTLLLLFAVAKLAPVILVIASLVITVGALAALIHFFLFWR